MYQKLTANVTNKKTETETVFAVHGTTIEIVPERVQVPCLVVSMFCRNNDSDEQTTTVHRNLTRARTTFTVA
jgi:hypothetical protein